MRTRYVRSLLIVSLLSMLGSTFIPTDAPAQDRPGSSPVQAGRAIRKPFILVQGDPCGCRFEYDNCRSPCTNYQGAAAQKGCIDRCLRYLQSCRAQCRR